MKKILLAITLFAAFAMQAATLNINGRLHTETGTLAVPITVSYDAAQAVPWQEPGWSLIAPVTLTMTIFGVTYDQTDDGDYPNWPGLVLYKGAPDQLDFVVLQPRLSIWRLGAVGPLVETPDGWSVQVFVDASASDFGYGLPGKPVRLSMFQPGVPEPGAWAMVVGLGLLGLVIGRRRRRAFGV